MFQSQTPRQPSKSMNNSKLLAQLTAAAMLQYTKLTKQRTPIPQGSLCVGKSKSPTAVTLAALASDYYDGDPQNAIFLTLQVLAINNARTADDGTIGARLVSLDESGNIWTKGNGWFLQNQKDHILMKWGWMVMETLAGRMPLATNHLVTTNEVSVGEESFSMRVTDPMILGLYAVCEALSNGDAAITAEEPNGETLRKAFTVAFTAANIVLTHALTGITTLPERCDRRTLSIKDDVVSGQLLPLILTAA